jgi:DNA-binding NarL/FixJ family response regulator
MSRPRILLADDHKMFAQGLESLLRDEFDFLARVGDGQSLVETAIRLDPDVVIVDISMPVLNGFDAVRNLKKLGSRAKIIFLTMHGDDSLVAEAFRCGASGYVLKQSAGEELISAIKQVLEGKTYITPLVSKEAARSTGSKETHSMKLTPRQREVLQLTARGRTMKEVATELGISTRTAESHKYEIMQELGLNTTAELVQYAIKLGLISV